MTQPAQGTVAVLGSINMDIVLQVPRFPTPGETILSTAVARYPGGKGANQAIAAARAGAAVRMIGAVGHDPDGQAMLSLLKAEGIDCGAIAISGDEATGTAYVLINETGENQIIVSQGPNAEASATIQAVEYVLLAQLEIRLDTVASFLTARQPGSIAILNAAPFHPDARHLLALADIIVVNEIELASYCGSRVPPASASKAIDMIPGLIDRDRQTAIVTRGKAGSVVVGPDGVLVMPARTARVVDTTGAGDCFCGFLAAGIATGRTLAVSIHQAHRAAAIAVERRGAAPSIPFMTEI